MIVFGARVFCPPDPRDPCGSSGWKYAVVPREVLRTNSVARALCEFAFMRFDESPELAVWSRAPGSAWGLEDEDEEVTVAVFDGGALDAERRVEATFVFGKRGETTVMRVACLDVVR